MAVAKEDIDRLIEATDMYALVSPYVKLIKSGSGYKGLCPFHDEKTPSFSVSQEKHIAKCFSCGKGGNPITFLKEIKHLTYIEAVKELAKINNMTIDIDDPQTKIDIQNQKYYEINDLANDLFTRNLFETNKGLKALEYLHNRGLDDNTIKEFGIGLAPDDGKMLHTLLNQAGYLDIDMVTLGLVRNYNDNYYDFFVNRITFPIRDIRGRIIGFSGRIFNNDNPNEAKYMNSIETPLFQKNVVLYNLDLAIDHIKRNDRVILHEGYMDVIASYRAGFKEVICSMGTQLTEGQLKIISRHTKNIILAFDGDNAGIRATSRAYEMAIKLGLNVSVMPISEAKDSDEFVKKYGIDNYKTFFNNHLTTFIDFIYNKLTNNLNLTDLTQIETVKKELFKYLKLTKSNLIAEKYLDLFSKKINISYNSLFRDFNNQRGYVNRPAKPQDKPQEPKQEIFRIYEVRLFDYAKSNKARALYIDKKLEMNNNFLGFSKISLWQALIEYYSSHEEYDEEEFIALLKAKDLFEQYYQMVSAYDKLGSEFKTSYTDQDLEDCLNKIKQQADEKKMSNLQKNINEQTDEDLKKELTIKKFNMRKDYERK